MSNSKLTIKPDSALHRLLKMVAEEVAKEYSVASKESTATTKLEKSITKRTRKAKSK